MAEALLDLYKRLAKDEQARDAEWRAEIGVDPDGTISELAKAAEIYSKWARLASRAKAIAAEKEGDMSAAWHLARTKARETLADEKSRVTEAWVDDLANQDMLFQTHAQQSRQAKALAADFKQIKVAMLQRLYMLQAINRRQTAELNQGQD